MFEEWLLALLPGRLHDPFPSKESNPVCILQRAWPSLQPLSYFTRSNQHFKVVGLAFSTAIIVTACHVLSSVLILGDVLAVKDDSFCHGFLASNHGY
ncbi:hypothetical protein Peur_049023 [Populus x canadensis]